MQRIQYYICFFTFLFLIQSCNPDQNGQNEIIIDVDDDFQIRFLEDLSSPQEDLILVLESIRNSECQGDQLIAKVNNYSNAIRIEVDVIPSRIGCEPGSAPIRTEGHTGSLEIGKLPISINFQELIPNNGSMLIGDRSYQLEMETTHGFYLPYKSLNRVPENLVWGYISFGSVYRQFAQEFVEELRLIFKDQQLGLGNYGHFEVASDQKITVLGQEKETFNSQSFAGFYSPEDLNQIQALIQDYKEKYTGIKFYVINSKGVRLAD